MNWKLSWSEEEKEIWRGMNKTSQEKCAIDKKRYEELYQDLEVNCPENIQKLARTRQRMTKDIDNMSFVRIEDGADEETERHRHVMDNIMPKESNERWNPPGIEEE